LDATSGQVTGHEFGPGFRVTVPIFNWNQGGIARAEAELDRAHRQKRTITNQVILEVRLAYQRYLQAVSELSYFEDHVQPENTAAMRRSELSFREGDTSYVMVLETSRRLLDGRIRAEQLNAEVRRTWSELERSVGCRLQDRPLQPRDIRPARARDGGRQ
jgi:cobalt-zinc-cadmium efflux system outer membrane protein